MENVALESFSCRSLTRFARRRLARRGLDVAVRPEIIPFSDHFSFNPGGVPAPQLAIARRLGRERAASPN